MRHIHTIREPSFAIPGNSLEPPALPRQLDSEPLRQIGFLDMF